MNFLSTLRSSTVNSTFQLLLNPYLSYLLFFTFAKQRFKMIVSTLEILDYVVPPPCELTMLFPISICKVCSIVGIIVSWMISLSNFVVNSLEGLDTV